MEACIGENITYTCNVSDSVHIWRAPELQLFPPTSVLIPHSQDLVTSRYILRLVSVDDNGNIISSLTVLSDAEFSNTNVTCADSFGAEVQQTIAVVLGECSYLYSCYGIIIDSYQFI